MTRRHPLVLTVLGGATEIGANSYHLDLGGHGLLLDAGLHPKRQGSAALPRFDLVQGDVDAVLVTHAHLDHVGALPVALQRFPAARVYMSGPSSLLAVRMLRNAAAIAHNSDVELPEPLYGHDHVEWVEQVVNARELGQPFELGAFGRERLRLTFLGAGHVLGASGILIEYRGRRIFYTGDTCATAQCICGAASYPAGPVDLLLIEGTHGADAAPSLPHDRRGFAKAAAQLGRLISSVAARGGSVLLPVFALGRSQEILGVLSELAQRGRIPPLPIYVSGLAHAICRIYDATRRDSERRHPGLRLEDLGYRILGPEQAAGDPDLLKHSSIFAVTSGMMGPRTTSNVLAQRMLSDPKHAVAIVGFVDPESVGYRVAQSQPDELVDLGGGTVVPRICPVESLSFTAHSRASQLLETVRQIAPERTILVHGDLAAVTNLERQLAACELRAEVAMPGTRIEC